MRSALLWAALFVLAGCLTNPEPSFAAPTSLQLLRTAEAVHLYETPWTVAPRQPGDPSDLRIQWRHGYPTEWALLAFAQQGDALVYQGGILSAQSVVTVFTPLQTADLDEYSTAAAQFNLTGDLWLSLQGTFYEEDTPLAGSNRPPATDGHLWLLLAAKGFGQPIVTHGQATSDAPTATTSTASWPDFTLQFWREDFGPAVVAITTRTTDLNDTFSATDSGFATYTFHPNATGQAFLFASITNNDGLVTATLTGTANQTSLNDQRILSPAAQNQDAIHYSITAPAIDATLQVQRAASTQSLVSWAFLGLPSGTQSPTFQQEILLEGPQVP